MDSVKIQPHILLQKGDVQPVVLTMGDPARALQIAETCTNFRALSKNREYHSYEVQVDVTSAGSPVLATVISHGVGSAGATICFEELIACGAKCIIRLGTCGSLQTDKILPGDVVVIESAVREDGVSALIAPKGLPATADHDVVSILRKNLKASIALAGSAENETQWLPKAHLGCSVCSDLFYAPPKSMSPTLGKWRDCNVEVVEMECAPLFLLGRQKNILTAAICCVDGSPFEWKEGFDPHNTNTSKGKSLMLDAGKNSVKDILALLS